MQTASAPLLTLLGLQPTQTASTGGQTALSAAATAAAESVSVVSAEAAGLAVGAHVQIGGEVLLVRAITADTVLGVARGAAGSTAAAHSDGAAVQVVLPIFDAGDGRAVEVKA